MYIAVSGLQLNSNPGSFYISAQVISSGGTQSSIEVFADDDATAEEIHAAIAVNARAKCRENSEDIDSDAPVMLFGTALQVV